VVGATTEIGGEEDSGDCERRVERMERVHLIPSNYHIQLTPKTINCDNLPLKLPKQ
jgi:hypothetical protein